MLARPLTYLVVNNPNDFSNLEFTSPVPPPLLTPAPALSIPMLGVSIAI